MTWQIYLRSSQTYLAEVNLTRFPIFFEKLFLNEGGFSNDPNDSGGKTIYGITQNNFPKQYSVLSELYFGGKKELAKNYAMGFYEKLFWNPLYDKIIDSSLAFKVFDLGVNMGETRAVELLERTLKNYFNINIVCDGVFDDKLLIEVNTVHFLYPKSQPKDYIKFENETLFYSLYCFEVEKFYKSRKTFWKFGKGWLRRLKDVFNKVPNLPQEIIATPKGLEKI